MLKYLEELCLLNGVSGDEDKVRNYIVKKIKDKCDYKIDPLGNLLAFKKGKNEPKNKVMISAHMDEVGGEEETLEAFADVDYDDFEEENCGLGKTEPVGGSKSRWGEDSK